MNQLGSHRLQEDLPEAELAQGVQFDCDSSPHSALQSGSSHIVIRKTFIEVDDGTKSRLQRRRASWPDATEIQQASDSRTFSEQVAAFKTSVGAATESASSTASPFSPPKLCVGFRSAETTSSSSGARPRPKTTFIGFRSAESGVGFHGAENGVGFRDGGQDSDDPDSADREAENASATGHWNSEGSDSRNGNDREPEVGIGHLYTSERNLYESEGFFTCADSEAEKEKTTVMLKYVPRAYTRSMLLELLDSEGFAAQYDFVYLPIDFASESALGYAFINLIDPESAESFWDHFHGFTGWSVPSNLVATVNWSREHQGFDQHVQRYRDSPLMHESMPDECKPVIFEDGVLSAFPPPTKPLRRPRIRPKNRCSEMIIKENESVF